MVVSASLDGTVRAFDLVRYRNFRIMKPPVPNQLLSLAIDPSAEIVCAGGQDPFDIYVWSLQTGKLLDSLAGHDGPVCDLAFSQSQMMLASASWDATVRLWDPFEGKGQIEALDHNSEVLACDFRPDGRELCSAAADGQLYVWDTYDAALKFTIQGRWDLGGGRRKRDFRTAQGTAQQACFTKFVAFFFSLSSNHPLEFGSRRDFWLTFGVILVLSPSRGCSVCYNADGTCVIAGGNSRYVCIYELSHRLLLRRFGVLLRARDVVFLYPLSISD